MRRLPRWALNALTAISLLLCVAAVALWVRSYWYMDDWFASRAGERLWLLSTESGAVDVSVTWPYPEREWDHRAYRLPPDHRYGKGVPLERQVPAFSLSPWARLSDGSAALGTITWDIDAATLQATPSGKVRWYNRWELKPVEWAGTIPKAFPVRVVNVSLRYWHLVVVTMIVPALRLPRVLRRARGIDAGQRPCPSCRYDLTGNVSGVCPECGTVITKGAT